MILRALILLAGGLALAPQGAKAQFSVQDADGKSEWRLFGSTWRPSFFSLASTETDKFNDDGGRLSTYNYVTFATYLRDSYRFALRVPFQYNTAGTDRFGGDKLNEQEMFLHDIILSMQKYDLLLLPWDMGLYWEGRMYLPTSQHARKTKMITRLRNQFILSKHAGRHFELEYDQKFNYYIQSQTAYRNEFTDADGFPVDTVSATKRMEFENVVRVWGKINAEWGLGWSIGTEDSYWNKSQAEDRQKPGERLVKTGPQMRFPLTDNANFIFSYEERVNRDENGIEFGKFLAKNTQFVLLSFVRF